MTTHKTSRKCLGTLTAVALIGAAGMVAMPKNADATAYSYVAFEVTNFEMFGLTNGFSSFAFLEKGMNVHLNGLNGNQAASSTVTTQGASLDDPLLCVGDCGTFDPALNNDYFGAAAPTGAGGQGSFAMADMHMTNTVIAAGNANGPGNFGAMAGAQFSGSGFAAGNVVAAQEMRWNFTLSSESDVSFAWDHRLLMDLSTSQPDESATATVSYSIVVRDRINNVNVFADTIFGPFDSASIIPEDSPNGSLLDTGTVSDTAGGVGTALENLAAGDYSITILFDVTASVTSVPEPAALGLLGVGLLGLGVAGARRRKAAQAA